MARRDQLAVVAGLAVAGAAWADRVPWPDPWTYVGYGRHGVLLLVALELPVVWFEAWAFHGWLGYGWGRAWAVSAAANLASLVAGGLMYHPLIWLRPLMLKFVALLGLAVGAEWAVVAACHARRPGRDKLLPVVLAANVVSFTTFYWSALLGWYLVLQPRFAV